MFGTTPMIQHPTYGWNDFLKLIFYGICADGYLLPNGQLTQFNAAIMSLYDLVNIYIAQSACLVSASRMHEQTNELIKKTFAGHSSYLLSREFTASFHIVCHRFESPIRNSGREREKETCSRNENHRCETNRTKFIEMIMNEYSLDAYQSGEIC